MDPGLSRPYFNIKPTTIRRISIYIVCQFFLDCIRILALAGVSFGSRGIESTSCPYRRSPLLLQQRKLPF